MANSQQQKERRRLLDQPPDVIQRWVRLRASSKGKTLARAIMRRWLPITERKRKKALEAAFDAVTKKAIKSEANGYQASLTIENIALYFLLAERDIQSLKIDALAHRDEWTRKLCARVILLTIHEWDMDKACLCR